jgi:hypothetical protein
VGFELLTRSHFHDCLGLQPLFFAVSKIIISNGDAEIFEKSRGVLNSRNYYFVHLPSFLVCGHCKKVFDRSKILTHLMEEITSGIRGLSCVSTFNLGIDPENNADPINNISYLIPQLLFKPLNDGSIIISNRVSKNDDELVSNSFSNSSDLTPMAEPPNVSLFHQHQCSYFIRLRIISCDDVNKLNKFFVLNNNNTNNNSSNDNNSDEDEHNVINASKFFICSKCCCVFFCNELENSIKIEEKGEIKVDLNFEKSLYDSRFGATDLKSPFIDFPKLFSPKTESSRNNPRKIVMNENQNKEQTPDSTNKKQNTFDKPQRWRDAAKKEKRDFFFTKEDSDIFESMGASASDISVGGGMGKKESNEKNKKRNEGSKFASTPDAKKKKKVKWRG